MTAPDVRLSSAQAVRLVAAREVTTRLRSKAFRISTAVTLLLLIGFAVVMKFVGQSADATIGLTGPSTSLEAPLKASSTAIGQNLDTRSVSDEAAGRAQVSDGTL